MLNCDDLPAMEKLLEKPSKKAEKLKPEVTIIEFGEYEVTGSLGQTYIVQFGENDLGEVWSGCRCKGSVRQGCYHQAAAFPIHKKLYFASGEPKEAVPYLKPTSGKQLDKVGNVRI